MTVDKWRAQPRVMALTRATTVRLRPTLNGQPAVKMFGNGAPLTADEEYEAGFYCGGLHATPGVRSPLCVRQRNSGPPLIKVPAPETESDDHNPPRIASRNLFDASVGLDNAFHGDKRKWDMRITVVNLMNKVALYNFPFHFQRYALRYAAGDHGSDRVPLLTHLIVLGETGGPVRSGFFHLGVGVL